MKKITLLFMFLSTFWTYAQVSSYAFTQTQGTYTEITGGTLLGTETSDAQKFLDPASPAGSTLLTGVGFPIGFNFIYNGFSYDRFGVCNDGWISLGSSVFTPSVNMTSSSSSAPLSSTSVIAQEELANKICGLAKDLQGQVGSTLRIETVGTAPNRTLIIQWKNYRKYNATGDSFNFQIRLNETSNVIDFVYGDFSSNATASANYHVGLRATPATTVVNFTSRTSTTGWGVTTPGLVATNSVLMSDVLIPSNGLTFTWTPPFCGGATGLVSSAITTSGATLTWSSALPAPVGYEYIVSSSSTFPTGSGTATANTTETVSGLNQNTVYNVFLRSNCGTQFTTWILAGTFKTLCLDTNYVNEGFDTYPASTTSIPDCWIKAGAGSAYITTGGTLPGTPLNRLYMFANGSGTSPTVAYAMLPSLNNLQAGTHRLRFKAYATVASRFLDIGYFTDPSDLSTFVVTETIALPSTTATSALELISTPTAIPVGVTKLAFRNVGISTGSTTLYIDDVTWEPIPTCPSISALVANGQTFNSVNLSWIAGGTETAWQYVVGTSNVTDPTTLTPVDAITTAVTAGGLLSNTSYKVWVRSNCGTTSLGAWIGPIVFSTTCAPVTEFSQNFDLATTFPACWGKVGTTGNVSILNSTTAPSLPNHLSLGSNGTVGMGVVAMPPVSNAGAGTHRLRFKFRGSVASTILEVGYLTDISNATSFVPLQTYTATSATIYDNINAILGTVPTTSYLAFRNPGSPTGFTDYIDDVFWEPIPTCPDISSLAITATTSTTASVNWLAGGTETAWQYVVGATLVTNPSTLTPVDVTSSTIVAGGLTPSTAYKMWVRSYCGTTSLGVWIGPITFTTTCAPVTEFTQNFDSGTTFSDCWGKVGTTGTATIVASTTAPSQPNYLSMNSTSAINSAVVAMKPVSNAGAGSHRLKFKFRGSVVGATVEVGYLTSISDPTSFVSLQNYAATSTTVYDLISAELGAEPVTQVLAFRKLFTTSSTVYIDDVVWEPIPTCPDVTTLASTGVTSTTADVTWVAGGTETAWQYAIGATAVTDPTTLTPVDVTLSAITVGGLTPSTAYKMWVRSNCGTTSLGVWIGPITFTTTCAPVTEFTQNFDSGTTFSDCWSKVGTTGTVTIVASTTAPSQPNYMTMSSTSAVNTAVVAMKPVSNAGAGSHRLKFKFRGSVVGATVEVGYLTNISDPTSFIPLQTYAATSTTVYDIISVELGTEPATQFLAFRKLFTTSSTVYIDDVAWEPIPTCPDVSALASTGVTSTTADVTWVAGGTETAWQYAIGDTTVTDPTTLTPVDVTLSAITIGGLTPSTARKIWVRSYCGTTSLGVWIGPITFTTTCAPVTEFTQNFDSGTTFSDCWSKVGTTGTATIVASTTAPSQPNYLSMNSSSAINTAVVAMKPVSNAGAGSHRLKFKFRGSVVGATVEVGYLTNISDPTSFIPLQTYAATSTTVYDLISAELGTEPATQVLAFRKLYTTSSTVYIDDVVWEPIPTCPDVTALASTGVTSTTADVTWVAGGTETAWQYVIGATSVTDPTTLTPVDVTLSAITVGGLTPSTARKMWVRSNCGTTSLGVWIGPITFTTTCAPVTEFTQNFDSGTTFSDCWSKVGTVGTATIVASTTASSLPNHLNMNSTSAINTAVVAMKPVSNAGAGTHRLKFKARGSVVGATVEVGYLTNISDPTSFVPLQAFAATSTTVYDTNVAILGTGPLSQVLAFRKLYTTSSSVYIDDVVWELLPSTVPVCASGITAVPNATCGNFATAISWTAAAGADGYKLTIGTTAGGTDVFNNLDLGGALNYSFVGNFNTTYYYTIKPYNSFGDATGCTEQSFVTAVNGCYCTSVPTSNDGLGISNVLLGTTNFPNGDVTYANYTATNVDLSQALTANVQISFATGFTYGTNIWIDYNNNFTFEIDEIVYTGVSLATNPTVLNGSFLVSASAPLGAHRMRIVATDVVQNPANPCYSGTYGVALDFNVTITAPPTCLPVTGLTVNGNTSDTASISWTAAAPAPANGYDYYVSATNTAPTGTTTPTGSVAVGVTTANLSALTPATVYYVWVRSVCSATDFSSWNTSVSFTTACVSATVPYSQNFETATVPGMPLCSTIENAGTGNNWTTVSNPGFGFTSKTLRYAYSGANAANAWYYTQPVTLAGGTSYDISYKYGNNSTTYVEKLKVTYGTVASSVSMTTVLADHPNIVGAVATTNTVSFTPTVSGDYYFGFNAYSIANQYYLYVDDISVQATLATNTFDSNGFTYYPNPVKDLLNLGYTQEITNVAVFNLLGQQVITKTVNANQSQIDMSNLTRGTYLVKVTADNQVKTIKVIKE